jgi:uncharacterized iron-regulated membrane protein
MRKVINKLHLWIGLASGIIILTVALTGSIYCFEEEIRNFAYHDVVFVNPGSQRSELSRSLDLVKEKFPQEKIRSIRIKSDPARSIEFILKDKRSVFVDPYSDNILGTVNKDKDLFGVVLKIHRSLLLDEVGKKITAAAALIFTLMLLSGIALWWPKRSNFSKKGFVVRTSSGTRKRNYDLHNVLGFYASLVIIFTVLTGLVFAYDWAESSMYWLTGSKKEERKKNPSSESQANAMMFPIDLVIASSDQLIPGSTEKFISLPEDSLGSHRVILQHQNKGIFNKRDVLFFDQYSGKVISTKLYSESSLGDKLKASNYNIHTGKALGLAGQILVFLAAIISASLPVTGFMIWRAKTKNK